MLVQHEASQSFDLVINGFILANLKPHVQLILANW